MGEQLLMLISPAKKLADEPLSYGRSTQPLFKTEILTLVEALKHCSMGDIGVLMHLSPKLAKLNYDRYQQFDAENFNKDTSTQALFTFQGDVYRAMAAESLSDKAMDYLNKHLLMLSGLYGFLRPTDYMQPYRLEMGTAFAVNGCANLYAFWREVLTKRLNAQIKKENIGVVLNCASQEYAKAVNFKALAVPVITCQFKQYSKGKLKSVGILSKKARGLMVRYLAEKQAASLKVVQAFRVDGYAFCPESSTADQYVFIQAEGN